MGVPFATLLKPRVVATAKSTAITTTHPFTDGDLPFPYSPSFGQDFEFGVGRAAPAGQSVSSNESELKAYFKELLNEFASQDTTGMAKELFNEFLAKNSTVKLFARAKLNELAAKHQNIIAFCNAALNAPKVGETSIPRPGRHYIHQALKAANWDINKLIARADLGVPAFNVGSKVWGTGDYANGLGLMINDTQHVFIIADYYHYDSNKEQYTIHLQYYIYDVFGLDDDDLREYGAQSSWNVFDAKKGITAWWQLQHQFGYAPLVTRIRVWQCFTRAAI